VCKSVGCEVTAMCLLNSLVVGKSRPFSSISAMLYSDLIVNQPRIPCNAVFDSSGLSQALPVPQIDSVTIVSRAEWGARESKEINYMGTPVSVVFVHHTAMNECLGQDECAQEMRVIQNFHMDNRGINIL